MIVYSYSPATGEFLGSETSQVLPGREDLLDSDLTKFLIPAHATTIAPISVQSKQVAVWNGSAWIAAIDRRGETWYDANRNEVVIEFIGDPWDHGLTSAPAPYTQEELDAQAAQQRLDMQKAVQAERARRLSLGFDHNFGNGRGVHRIGTTAADMEGWRDVTDVSNALIATGNGSSTINILTDTGPAVVTALEWQSVLISAAAVRQQIWAASFALQEMNPIPANYADDSYWTL